MNYPITAEQMSKEYESTNGHKIPDVQSPFWTGLTDLLNGAYEQGRQDALTVAKKAS